MCLKQNPDFITQEMYLLNILALLLAIETAVCTQEALERTMWEMLLITQLNPILLVTCSDAPTLGHSCL